MNSHILKLIIVIALIQLHLGAYSQSKLLLYEPFNYPAESTLSGRGLNGLRKTLSMSSDKILVCAHRGVHRTTTKDNYAAENSMTSIKEAIAKNVDIVEIDVRTSSDGVLVLMHDATLTRTTNGSGNVKDRTYSYLRALKLKIYGTNTLTSDTIPTLEQVLREFKNKVYFNLDVKAASLDAVYSLIQSTGMTDNVMVFVSDPTDAAYLISKGVMPLTTCYSNSTFNDLMLNNVRPLILHSDNEGHDEEWISIKKAGIKIFTNMYILNDINPTSDNWSLLNEAIRNGVNVVQTDYPIEMVNYLNTK